MKTQRIYLVACADGRVRRGPAGSSIVAVRRPAYAATWIIVRDLGAGCDCGKPGHHVITVDVPVVPATKRAPTKARKTP